MNTSTGSAPFTINKLSASQKGFTPIFIVLGTILILSLGLGGYIVSTKINIQNKPASNPKPSLVPIVTQTSRPTPISFPNASSAPTLTTQISEKVKIIDGSVYRISAIGKKELLLDKQNYQDKGVSNFIEVSLSPDKSKMFLFAQGGVSFPFLYYTPLNQIKVKYIDITQEAVWSHDSRLIAYSNRHTEADPNNSIYVYDTKLDKKLKISNRPTIKSLNYDYIGFSNPQWLDDDSGIKVHYSVSNGSMPYIKIIGEGDITLPVITEK